VSELVAERLALPHNMIIVQGTHMETTTTTLGDRIGGSKPADPVRAKVEGVASAAHRTTDELSDGAAARVERLSGTAHRAIDGAADAATTAAGWAAALPEQARQIQTGLTESASASIRARPIATVAGALAIGYLLGRLLRH
jgi:hypothetical protein